MSDIGNIFFTFLVLSIIFIVAFGLIYMILAPFIELYFDIKNLKGEVEREVEREMREFYLELERRWGKP